MLTQLKINCNVKYLLIIFNISYFLFCLDILDEYSLVRITSHIMRKSTNMYSYVIHSRCRHFNAFSPRYNYPDNLFAKALFLLGGVLSRCLPQQMLPFKFWRDPTSCKVDISLFVFTLVCAEHEQ